MAVLLRGVAVRCIAILLPGVARVVTARCEQLFIQAKFEETLGFGHAYVPDEKKNWKIKQDLRVIDKEISVPFVVDRPLRNIKSFIQC